MVRFLNIGQGDAQLLQLPDGQTILIDTGDNGKPTVQMLKDFGVQEIDLAIGTHPHADHIAQMLEVMRAFKVKEFWERRGEKLGAVPFESIANLEEKPDLLELKTRLEQECILPLLPLDQGANVLDLGAGNQYTCGGGPVAAGAEWAIDP